MTKKKLATCVIKLLIFFAAILYPFFLGKAGSLLMASAIFWGVIIWQIKHFTYTRLLIFSVVILHPFFLSEMDVKVVSVFITWGAIVWQLKYFLSLKLNINPTLAFCAYIVYMALLGDLYKRIDESFFSYVGISETGKVFCKNKDKCSIEKDDGDNGWGSLFISDIVGKRYFFRVRDGCLHIDVANYDSNKFSYKKCGFDRQTERS
jgi:hypothetical protein